VPFDHAPRREGDPAALFADPRKIQAELGWEPRFADLNRIVGSAVQWARAPVY
jgi:UDP-glucose 4-epimerase